MQIEELAACVGDATDFGGALLETGIVASEVVADQLALSVAQEAAHVLTGPARSEIIDHGLEVGEGPGCIPRRNPAGSFSCQGKHLHWGFAREDDVLPKQAAAKGIDQGAATGHRKRRPIAPAWKARWPARRGRRSFPGGTAAGDRRTWPP